MCPTFSRGSNCLFPIETHITCDFPGGSPDPLSPPLDPHLVYFNEKLHTYREHSGSVVECLTRDLGAAGASLTDVTVLCP